MSFVRQHWLGLAINIAILAAGAAWYFYSPAWTLSRMQAAARSNDPDAISTYIDYPALREDLKAEMMAQMSAESQKDNSGFGALGMAVGLAMAGPLIDQMVSPAGLRSAFIAKRNNPAANASKSTGPLRVPEEPVIVRRSFSEFAVTTKAQPNSGMVFRLHGLSWKLSGVDLPPPGQN